MAEFDVTIPDMFDAAVDPVTTPAADTKTPDMPDTDPVADDASDTGDASPDAPETQEPAPAAPAEATFALPDGTKLTAAQIQEAMSKAADYTKKTQELADQRRAIEAEQQQRQQQEQKRQSENLIDPITQANDWQRIYYEQLCNEYTKAGKDPATITAQQVQLAHLQATQNVMVERLNASESARAQETARADVERQRQWLGNTMDAHLNKEENVVVKTAEGRRAVRAELALALNERGEITEKDVADAVAHVRGQHQAIINSYVTSKSKTAATTNGIARGGGQVRAPEVKKLPAEMSSLRALEKELK
jgi:hypothetical protein